MTKIKMKGEKETTNVLPMKNSTLTSYLQVCAWCITNTPYIIANDKVIIISTIFW